MKVMYRAVKTLHGFNLELVPSKTKNIVERRIQNFKYVRSNSAELNELEIVTIFDLEKRGPVYFEVNKELPQGSKFSIEDTKTFLSQQSFKVGNETFRQKHIVFEN